MKNKGITLVALVITIIILLILAGITISQLTGSGLFENSKLAKEKYENERQKEESVLADFENKIVDGTRSDDYAKLQKEIEDLKQEVNTLKTNRLIVFDKDNVIQAETICTAGTEYTYTATQDCAISYQYYFKLADGGTGTCKVDDIQIDAVYCTTTSSSQYFESRGIIYVKKGQVFKIKSINFGGAYTVYGLK